MSPLNGHGERLVTIGGTFDDLHTGHKSYIRLAFEYADRVLIYVTSDEYVIGRKAYTVRPYSDRIDNLKSFIREIECENRYLIKCLHNQDELKTDFIENPDLRNNLYMTIVSPAYLKLFLKINRARETHNIKSFLILIKPRTLNPANYDVSSHEIRKPLYDYSLLKQETLNSANNGISFQEMPRFRYCPDKKVLLEERF
jgi:pantetheine-phosphate adenylyltransferase